MPGVPSGRGCEACRKQKKKCDQKQPVCGRCARLQISCIGSGMQRYKFKSETMGTVMRSTKTPSPKAVVRPPLSNQITFVTNAFISTFEIKDLRFDISCYGGFLKEIPKRLGKNDALDAAVTALISAFSSLHTHEQSRDGLVKYVHALKTLRMYLGDPVRAREPNTLCAIYLIMICQGWIGRPDDQYAHHGEVMAHLLSNAVSQEWQGAFEVEMLFTLCVPVIFESVANPRIKVDDWFTKLTGSLRPQFGPRKQADDPKPGPIESLGLRNLARIPEFVNNPHLYLHEVQPAYDQVVLDREKLRQILVGMSSSNQSSNPDPDSPNFAFTKMYTQYQSAYGLLLGLALVLNSILRAFDPFNVTLGEEAAQFSAETIALAEEVAKYRPLGSSYMPTCLTAAWVAMEGTSQQVQIEALLKDWQADFAETDWISIARWLKRTFERRALRSLSPMMIEAAPESMEVALLEEADEAAMGTVSACCVM